MFETLKKHVTSKPAALTTLAAAILMCVREFGGSLTPGQTEAVMLLVTWIGAAVCHQMEAA